MDNLSPFWLKDGVSDLYPSSLLSIWNGKKTIMIQSLPASSDSGCYNCFCSGCYEDLPHAHDKLCCIFQTDISYSSSGSCYALGKCPPPATVMIVSCIPRSCTIKTGYWNSFIAARHPMCKNTYCTTIILSSILKTFLFDLWIL